MTTAPQRLWLVRLGRDGEYEPDALDHNLVNIGFNMVHDLSNAGTRDQVLDVVRQTFPDAKPATQGNYAAQINQFVNVMAVGDLVVSPLRSLGKIGIARLVGPYCRLDDGRPARPIEWLTIDLARDAFRQDLLYSFGAFMTVCEIKRNNALARVHAVLKTGRDPGDGVAPIAKQQVSTGAPPSADDPAAEELFDLERIARDQIERRISSTFVGHDFTRLIAAILTAQGYQTHVSPPGPDAGIDIVAGRGALGFEGPRLVVQVKSGDISADQPSLQSLLGCIHDTGADQGLLVSWSGFKATVRKRTNDLYFRVRFWGRDEIVSALLDVYPKLPEAIRAELPLRPLWTLVVEGEVGT